MAQPKTPYLMPHDTCPLPPVSAILSYNWGSSGIPPSAHACAQVHLPKPVRLQAAGRQECPGLALNATVCVMNAAAAAACCEIHFLQCLPGGGG